MPRHDRAECINPETGRPYGTHFPASPWRHGRGAEAADRRFGDRAVAGVVGGSLGGHMVLTWATRFPDRIVGAIALATSAPDEPSPCVRCRGPHKMDHDIGRPFQERICNSPLKNSVAVENISAGYHTLAEAFSGWRDLTAAPRQYAQPRRHPHGHRARPGAELEVQGVLGAHSRRARAAWIAPVARI